MAEHFLAEFKNENREGHLCGYAVVFNQRANIGGDFEEIITPTALSNADLSDVLLYVEHDTQKIPLARSRKHTLEIRVDEHGLSFDAALDIDGNPSAAALYSAVQRGDIDSMSFGFVVDSDEWRMENGVPTRYINSIKAIHEISAVARAAYKGTSLEARSAQESAELWEEARKQFEQEASESVAEETAEVVENIAESEVESEAESHEAVEDRHEEAAEHEEEHRSVLDFNAIFTTTENNIERGANMPIRNEEKRSAFMNWLRNGGEVPAEIRAVGNTTGNAAAIPTELSNQILMALEKEAVLYPRVRKSYIPFGQAFAKDTTTVTASWVAEGAGSTPIAPTTTLISLTAYKLRCEIQYTWEVEVETIPAFEQHFAQRVAKAIVNAIEAAIVNGDGSGKPTGFMNGVSPTSGTYNYAGLIAMEKAIPVAYANKDVYVMNSATFWNIQGIVDSNGNPVARLNYGLSNAPAQTLLGREVILSESMAANTVCAINLDDYLIKVAAQLTDRERDWDTENVKIKQVMLVDGKMLLTDSRVAFTLSAPAQG